MIVADFMDEPLVVIAEGREGGAGDWKGERFRLKP
jgi:hypothetical protein